MASLMLLTCKSWYLIVMRALEQTSPTNTIFLSIAEAKARWRAILTRYLQNWMQKYKDKWPPNHLIWKRWTHSLMKWFISCSGALCISMAIGIKWCLLWSLLYLKILTMALSSTVAFVGQLMTFKTPIFHGGLITTTLSMKTWSFQIM
jgi:hypothetical protein